MVGMGDGGGRLVGAVVGSGVRVGRGALVGSSAVAGAVVSGGVGRPPSAAPMQLRMTRVIKPMAILPRQPAFQRRAMAVVIFCKGTS